DTPGGPEGDGLMKKCVAGVAAVCGATAGACAGATLVADYRFHGNFASAVAGAPILAAVGSVSFTTVTINGQSVDGASFAEESGLQMAAPPGFTAPAYSIVEQFEIDTTPGYRKLVDFSDLLSDTGLYNLSGLLE